MSEPQLSFEEWRKLFLSVSVGDERQKLIDAYWVASTEEECKAAFMAWWDTQRSKDMKVSAKVVPMVAEHEFKIEKGVPIPRKGCGLHPRDGMRDTLRKMAIGDSIFVPFKPGETMKSRGPNLSSLTRKLDAADLRRFTIRSSPTGIRVWRIK
jgi:hypothetical protein